MCWHGGEGKGHMQEKKDYAKADLLLNPTCVTHNNILKYSANKVSHLLSRFTYIFHHMDKMLMVYIFLR